MKNFKRLKIKIFKGVIKPIEFLILFGLFFSSLAFAGVLSVTWEAARIPGGNNHFTSDNPGRPFSCRSSTNGQLLTFDRTEDPTDGAFSDDGLTVFTSNTGTGKLGNNGISQNKLDRPFDIASDRVFFNSNATCDDLDGLAGFTASDGALTDKAQGIDVVNNGKIFFVLDNDGRLGKFNAVNPNDVDGIVYETKIDFELIGLNDALIRDVAFSRDGTKMFTLTSRSGTDAKARQLTTFSLPGPFDISSHTQIHQVDFFDLDVTDDGDVVEIGRGIEFNQDGSAMFLLVGNTDENDETDMAKNYIYQFSLSKNFDISTATKVGRLQLGLGTFKNRASDNNGMPRGFTFASDGMKLFILDNRPGGGVDQINQFRLECPFGVISCSSDASKIIVSQVELAKQNISLNIDTIFKRFEWIKRNRDNEELSSHNININYPNPLLKSLVSKFEPSLKNNLATLVSNTQKKKKKKKSKWSSWSIAEISVGNYDKTLLDNPKDIYTKGLTFGSDRKIGDDKFFGLAVRYGNSESDIRKSVREVDLESLTLNIYGVVPTSNTQYINAVLGLSALRFDNKYLQAISGERNGKQAFASINYRTKTAYSKFNITPTGKLTYGVTRLSEFTDFLSNTIDSPTTDRRYAEDTFESGEFAGGLLFEMEKYESEQGSLQPMGGIEIIYDLTDDITYKYQNVGATAVNKEILSGKYSRQNLKTNIGFEAIHANGFTVSTDYQRTIRLNDKRAAPTFTTERFIIKFSKSKEDDTQFALDFDPLSNNSTNLSYAKDIGNFNLKFNSNYSHINRISDYGANIELSGTF